jgi:putative restriction endonuclease
VVENFSGRCCVSGISETSMLIASHIVPWSANKNFRSDPGNGLLLFVEYDAYFDKGYISIDEELRIVVTDKVADLSNELQARLKEIEGRRIESPKKYKIKNEYIEHHKNFVMLRRGGEF